MGGVNALIALSGAPHSPGTMYAVNASDSSARKNCDCREMEAAVWTDANVADMLNNKYVLISLYVDDKTPLKEPLTVTENGTERTLRTVGDKWSYLQRVKFGANTQPFYVLLDNQGRPLAGSRSYDKDISDYLKFLQTGLERYGERQAE